MTVYSWNMLFRNKRLGEALAFVRDSGADIFCLQEVPEAALPYMEALPYHAAIEKEVDLVHQGERYTSYLVMLSRCPITSHKQIKIGSTNTARNTSSVARALYALGLWGLATSDQHAMVADITTTAGPLRVYNLHLSLTHPGQRAKEFERALAEHNPDMPTLICGDFNILEQPRITGLNWLLGGRFSDFALWRRERTRIEERFASHRVTNPLRGRRTHPLSRSQLDHILISKEFAVEDAEVIQDLHGSDHRPVRARIRSASETTAKASATAPSSHQSGSVPTKAK